MINYNFFNRQSASSRQTEGISYVRAFHASPKTPAVDVYANGSIVARDFPYGQFTDYIPVPAGNYTIEVYLAGQKNNPILTANVNLPEKEVFTVAVMGMYPNISLFPIADEYDYLPPNRVNLRFANLSPDVPSADLTLRIGRKFFEDVEYGEVSSYKQLFPGVYNFLVRQTGFPEDLLYVPNITLYPRRNLTIYFTGLKTGSPPLQIYIPMDGTTYLRF